MTIANSTSAAGLVQRVWNYAHVLKDDGLAFMEYTEQITYLLFLKMAWEQRTEMADNIPSRYTWGTLRSISDDKKLHERYAQTLKNLSSKPGILGLIFTKPQSKINDPAKLRLLINMIDSENWSELDFDVKGQVYEGLLAKNADDVRGGAGQYFTPRPVIRAIVDVMKPKPGMRIADPACGTGGFLLAAFEYLTGHTRTARDAKLIRNTLHGADIVPSVARLCAMNLYLHGVGMDHDKSPVSIGDSLTAEPALNDMVLTNPPFGKKSSFTIVGTSGRPIRERLSYTRKGFWATTSNKQLNFLQHVYTMLDRGGAAAVVVPDNVLFEAGAGEVIRRELLKQCNVHTLLRLPTGIWYATGVKANVLFFDNVQDSIPATKKLWVYDLRKNRNFTLRTRPIGNADLLDFIKSYNAESRNLRQVSDCFRCFTYEEIMSRDKANLDITWQSSETKSIPEVSHVDLMQEIINDLKEAMEYFAAVDNTSFS